MSDGVSTHIDRVNFSNFRLFGELEIDFERDLTVIVAPNGGGKTSVLDGLALLLRPFVDTMDGLPQARGFRQPDIRRVLAPGFQMQSTPPVSVGAWAHFGGGDFAWSRAQSSEKARTSTAGGRPLKDIAERSLRHVIDYADRKRPSPPELPLIAYYSTGRHWAPGQALRIKRRSDPTPNSVTRGYSDALVAGANYRSVADWFVRGAMQVGPIFDDDAWNKSLTGQSQKAVIDVVASILAEPTGWSTLSYNWREAAIVLGHRDGRWLPVELLSAGIKTMVGLAADMAHRCARLNPHYGAEAAKRTPGIVLIDEVDMHLHPEWQQVVLQSLCSAFPRVQFIVTTHSPQVLSTVQADSIRILSEREHGVWRAHRPEEETLGVESSRVMATVMDVNPVPASVEETEWVTEFHRLAAVGEFESPRAHELRGKLVARYGETHPIVQDCDRLVRLERFKQRLGKSAPDATAKAE